MPVRKFRSVADMPGVQPRAPLDPENLRLACSLTQFAYWLHPMKHIPGVRKYRSVEEAWQARKKWVRSQLRCPAAPVLFPRHEARLDQLDQDPVGACAARLRQ